MHTLSSWLALLPCAAALTASWQPVPGSVVPPRSGATASTDGASTWLFGGYAEADGERAVVNDLHRLDATATGWTRVRESADGADVPGPRLATASAVLDGEMLLFGGWDPQVRVNPNPNPNPDPNRNRNPNPNPNLDPNRNPNPNPTPNPSPNP